MPDEQSDATQNTGQPDAAQNTGDGQAPKPKEKGVSADERQRWIDQGYRTGLERALKKLGLPLDLGEATEHVQSLRNPSQPEPEPTPDAAAHQQQYTELMQKHGKLERNFRSLEKEREGLLKQIETYKAKADVARVEKLKAAALSKGVGGGKQVEAFVRLYGDAVQFDDESNLVVVSKYIDGQFLPSGQSIEEYIDDALAESRFLLAVEKRQGSGSVQKPVRPETRPPDEAARDELLHSLGHGGKTDAKLDRVFGRLTGEST